ncbi:MULTISPECIES: hypothetical protein [Streptomyces]|uniref:hypothetical protein n=1 Tax=Streptomyces TaxID=1883 RepID=UPI001CCED0CD|nr:MULTISPECIES: hypothetical protein [Streptomyces]UBI41373.1 hypothetical protein K7I03_07995 [Streptomyces mobaraensis]UKW33870.1 hypothetical protein MCU78_07980 [Streptomyces sp. TYQ1024]
MGDEEEDDHRQADGHRGDAQQRPVDGPVVRVHRRGRARQTGQRHQQPGAEEHGGGGQRRERGPPPKGVTDERAQGNTGDGGGGDPVRVVAQQGDDHERQHAEGHIPPDEHFTVRNAFRLTG